jgi:hypothetical protein
MNREYFKGPVTFVDQGFFRATYSVDGDVNNIIKVKNSTHVRMLHDQFGRFPQIFDIVAPMSAVRTIRGSIPRSFITNMSDATYKSYRSMYY